jgi:hemoglobin-like flavoprotein
MNQQQIELVKDSWRKVSAMDPIVVGNMFYTHLFEANPQLKTLFRHPMEDQSQKLFAMIGYVIAKLEMLDDIVMEVKKLAKRHVHYGVKESHYTLVGQSLMWTLCQGLSEHWTKELEEAWELCYSVLSSVMIEASKEHELKQKV